VDAGEYPHVGLGMIFLKYVSDVFIKRHEALQRLVDDPDSEYYICSHGHDAPDGNAFHALIWQYRSAMSSAGSWLCVLFSNSSPAMVEYSLLRPFGMDGERHLPASRIGTFEFGSVGMTRTRVPRAEGRSELVVSEKIAGIEIPDSRLAAGHGTSPRS
jgi:hypothetical protein